MDWHDVEYFMDLYINAKRRMLANKFIKLPADGSKPWKKLIEVAEVIAGLYADPSDFINYAIKYYAPMRIFPTPAHLLADRFLSKFRYHQSLKNVYNHLTYSVRGDVVFIYNTGESVSLKADIMCPIDQDARLKFAMHLAKTHKEGNTYDFRNWLDIHYALVKLTHLGKPIPEELKQIKEIADENNRSKV